MQHRQRMAALQKLKVVATLQKAAQLNKMKRPAFHVAPKTGWINDPNAPILIKDTYHLFYQHVPESSEWQWGLVWGHAKSKDLVQWEHLPVALAPTPGGLDRHGCFSGCATVDMDGHPTMLYTGVIRKSPDEMEPGSSHQHEAQMLAVAADPDDPDLREWHKRPGSFLPAPPPEMGLTGWRDPFVLQRPCISTGQPWWYVMVGAGVKDAGGTALVYRSTQLRSGWEFVGQLCRSDSSHMWECPILAQLSNTSPQLHACIKHSNDNNGSDNNGTYTDLKQRHMFCVSPDYCVNMARYWLGDYADGTFDIAAADGPHLLDLGDILYAPNLLTDKQGRTVLWAWMQEKRSRPAGTYNSACCLCVPRVLYLSADGSTLLQEPLPELSLLRHQEGAWHVGESAGPAAPAVQLAPGTPLQLGPGSGGSHLDVEIAVARGSADSVVLLLQPFEGAPEGAAGAGVAYSWTTNSLQVIHATDLATLAKFACTPIEPPAIKKLPAEAPEDVERAAAVAAVNGCPARCGGRLRSSAAGAALAGEAAVVDDTVRLRILVDGSCLEVFTGTGEALGTRVYRGDEPPLDHGDVAAATTAAAGNEDSGSGPGSTTSTMMGWLQDSCADVDPPGTTGGELQLVAFGGRAQLLSASLYAMSDMWLQSEDLSNVAAAPALADAGVAATTAAVEVLQGLVAAELAAVTAAAAAVPVVLPVSGLSLDAVSTGAAAASTAGAEGHGMAQPVSPSVH